MTSEKTLATRIDIFEEIESELGLKKGIGFISPENLGWVFQMELVCAKGK